MTARREIEETYDVDGDAVLPVLDCLDRVASAEPGVQLLEVTCFDTPDLALARAGITVDRRTGGHDDGWHLTLPTARARYRIQVPLGRARVTVPQQLRDIVWVHARGEGLAAVLTLHIHRAEHRLLNGSGGVLATVSEEVVTVESAGPLRAWREWKVALVEGDRSLLRSVRRLLRGAGARRSTASSALERALGERLAGPEAPTPVRRKKDPAASLVHARLAEQVTELVRRDPLVRADAQDGVHKMRVATRRLRSNLATFRPVLDRDATDPLRDELRWLGQVLGAVRDSQVQAEHLRSSLDETASGPAELVRGPVRSRLRDQARSEHAEARTVALEALTSPRYAALVDRLAELASNPPWLPAAWSSVRKVLRPRVRREAKRLAKDVAAAAADAGRKPQDERLHEVRKSAKRARYAAEPLVAVYGADVARFVKSAKRIQAVLGDHHDTVAARARLRDVADLAAHSGEDGFTYGVLHERERQRAARLEAEFAALAKRLPTI